MGILYDLSEWENLFCVYYNLSFADLDASSEVQTLKGYVSIQPKASPVVTKIQQALQQHEKSLRGSSGQLVVNNQIFQAKNPCSESFFKESQDLLRRVQFTVKSYIKEFEGDSDLHVKVAAELLREAAGVVGTQKNATKERVKNDNKNDIKVKNATPTEPEEDDSDLTVAEDLIKQAEQISFDLNLEHEPAIPTSCAALLERNEETAVQIDQQAIRDECELVDVSMANMDEYELHVASPTVITADMQEAVLQQTWTALNPNSADVDNSYSVQCSLSHPAVCSQQQQNLDSSTNSSYATQSMAYVQTLMNHPGKSLTSVESLVMAPKEKLDNVPSCTGDCSNQNWKEEPTKKTIAETVRSSWTMESPANVHVGTEAHVSNMILLPPLGQNSFTKCDQNSSNVDFSEEISSNRWCPFELKQDGCHKSCRFPNEDASNDYSNNGYCYL